MADHSTTTPVAGTARSSSAVAPILLDMADTTWRMFLPTIGLLLLGRHYDLRFGTKPWLMLAGALVGALVAAFLIRRQMTTPRKHERGETK